ncbi:MAG: hypothetical protein V4586_00055 [Pseudomonadota bacterium]
MLTLTRALALCLCLSSPALAECVTPGSLANGVIFTREDGYHGLIRAVGDTFEIDYVTNPTGSLRDQRQSKLGIYDMYRNASPVDPSVPGFIPGDEGVYGYKFRAKPPIPKAGKTWGTKIHVLRSYENMPTVKQVSSYKVTYRYLATKTAKLSGCTYAIQPVEAHFIADYIDLTRRWIYFPDLGFGLETRVIDSNGKGNRELGLTSLTPKG